MKDVKDMTDEEKLALGKKSLEEVAKKPIPKGYKLCILTDGKLGLVNTNKELTDAQHDFLESLAINNMFSNRTPVNITDSSNSVMRSKCSGKYIDI